MEAHAAWYTRRFGECRPEWFVFAFGSPLPADPTRPITSFKTAWIKVREKAGVKGTTTATLWSRSLRRVVLATR